MLFLLSTKDTKLHKRRQVKFVSAHLLQSIKGTKQFKKALGEVRFNPLSSVHKRHPRTKKYRVQFVSAHLLQSTKGTQGHKKYRVQFALVSEGLWICPWGAICVERRLMWKSGTRLRREEAAETRRVCVGGGSWSCAVVTCRRGTARWRGCRRR